MLKTLKNGMVKKGIYLEEKVVVVIGAYRCVESSGIERGH
jgi:hypothetical protein